MKCIKNKLTDEIRRVNDKEAKRLIDNSQGWWYCPKEEWKAKVRDAATISPPSKTQLKRERKKARRFASKAEERRHNRMKKEAA